MKNKAWLEYVVTEEEAGLTVEQIVREKLHVSGRMLQRLTRSKGIQVNRKPPYLKRQVKAGDRVSVRVADQAQAAQREQAPFTGELVPPPVPILYEDQDFLIVNKPAGMTVHPTHPSQTGTLVQRLDTYLRSREFAPHAVHRLDKETTGTVLIAKSSYAHQLADKILRANELHREYLAIVSGQLEQTQGTINQPIARDPGHPTKRRVHPKGDLAVTHYQVVTSNQDFTLVRVNLETGRTHQIRVHFESLGYPLAGDTLYGGRKGGFRRVALHASKLEFTHPVSGQKVAVEAPLPDDFAQFIQHNFAKERTGE